MKKRWAAWTAAVLGLAALANAPETSAAMQYRRRHSDQARAAVFGPASAETGWTEGILAADGDSYTWMVPASLQAETDAALDLIIRDVPAGIEVTIDGKSAGTVQSGPSGDTCIFENVASVRAADENKTVLVPVVFARTADSTSGTSEIRADARWRQV